MDKYTGKRLDGRYEIQELIGVGGMAMVYKAYDTVDDKTVAIKILKDEFLGNSEFIRRFKNESKAIAVLSHPNIVKVYDVSFGDRIQYIVMEYIDGITLKEYISHQHVIPWKEAVHFTVQILQALQHAHEKGIVHRDMKPQNIMLLQDGSIKVTDFGIARFSNNETRTMTDKAIGSVHYIAPEQARGDNTDGKADIYSVGVMLYEMLTGKLPFDADSAVSVAIMQMQSDPKPLREINDKIPEGIEEITLRAMRKDPKQRYANAGEMLEAIEIFRHNPSVSFRYSYFVDETPTKYVDSLSRVPAAAPEPVYEDSYDSYDDELAGSGAKTAVKWITAIVVLLVVAAIGVIVWMQVSKDMKANEVNDVDVPNFVGKLYDDIQANKDYKFKFEISARYDSSKPVNVVLEQDPQPGSKQVKENATIKLTINSTSTTNEVPKIKNYSEQEAIERIESKYFGYNISRVNSSTVSKGYVVDCSPQEGTEQEIGTVITIIVSDGPASEKEVVPDVIGQTYEAAKAALEAKGFTTQRSTVASSVAEGKVVNTDPLAGNSLTKGTLINIQVSDGTKSITPLKKEVDLPEDEDADITLTIYSDGSQIDEKSGSPFKGFRYELEISPNGATNYKKIITVMLDGKKYEVFTFDFKNKSVSTDFLDTDYKVKKPGSDESDTESSDSEITSLDVKKNNAVNQLQYYLDSHDFTDENKKKADKIVNDATKKINSATSAEKVDSLLADALAALEAIPTEEPTSSQGSGDDLDKLKNDAISEIKSYTSVLNRFYTDDVYEQMQGIIQEYTDKINAATTEEEIWALDIEAKNAIEALPYIQSENP